MMTEALFQPIETLPGISKKRAGLYHKIGIMTIYDLLYYLPRDYKDYREPVAVREAVPDQINVIQVMIKNKKNMIYTRSGTQLFLADAEDNEKTPVGIVIFNQRFVFQSLVPGECYIMCGRMIYQQKEHRFVIQNPQILKDAEIPIEAIYPQISGLTSAMIRTNIKACLSILDESGFETLPETIRAACQLMPLIKAFHVMHQPETLEEIEEARRRLAFEEMLRLQCGLHVLKYQSKTQCRYRMQDVAMKPFYDSLPFSLTTAQQKAVQEILMDLKADKPMNRLLQGDVGSGKTAVAAAACYFCIQNNYQCILMAPTEILAEQHFQTLCDFLHPLGISVTLLTGSLKAKEKKERYAAIADGSVKMIVGTHAVFQKAVIYQNPGLVITDEQHRFGVAQRAALAEKGNTPHKLVMSATPIPRTLALMVYGDLDVSVIDVMPNGRLPIKTYAVTGGYRQRVLRFMMQELKQGHQAYIVCPAIDENQASELKSVTAYADQIREQLLSDWQIDILHGQMSPQEKELSMQKFRNHETDVLICTTVVEVGVDVPNATIMIIEDAERFGLSQLHQLRGRVGRGQAQSYCILITEHATQEAKERLRLLSNTTNGFQVAEADLKLRGPGDFFGNIQHGLPPLKLAPMTDTVMLHEVFSAVNQLLSDDPALQKPEHAALYAEILSMFQKQGITELH